jgi:hypothetical protein
MVACQATALLQNPVILCNIRDDLVFALSNLTQFENHYLRDVIDSSRNCRSAQSWKLRERRHCVLPIRTSSQSVINSFRRNAPSFIHIVYPPPSQSVQTLANTEQLVDLYRVKTAIEKLTPVRHALIHNIHDGMTCSKHMDVDPVASRRLKDCKI